MPRIHRTSRWLALTAFCFANGAQADTRPRLIAAPVTALLGPHPR